MNMYGKTNIVWVAVFYLGGGGAWDSSLKDTAPPPPSGVSSKELREMEHPPQLWHNSKLSISVTTIVTHN